MLYSRQGSSNCLSKCFILVLFTANLEHIPVTPDARSDVPWLGIIKILIIDILYNHYVLIGIRMMFSFSWVSVYMNTNFMLVPEHEVKWEIVGLRDCGLPPLNQNYTLACTLSILVTYWFIKRLWICGKSSLLTSRDTVTGFLILEGEAEKLGCFVLLWCFSSLSLRCMHAAAVESWCNVLSTCTDRYLMQLEFTDKEPERQADRLWVRGTIFSAGHQTSFKTREQNDYFTLYTVVSIYLSWFWC